MATLFWILTVLVAAPAARAPLPMAAVVQRNATATPAQVTAEDGLRHALSELGVYRVLPAADTQFGMSEARGANWQCDGAPACMVQLNNVLGTPVLVDVVCTNQADGIQLDARVLQDKAIQRQAQMWLPADPQKQTAALKRLARMLTTDTAALWVRAPTGTQVCVDQECVAARDSVATVDGLAPGSHVVTLSVGNKPMERTVVMPAKQPTRLNVGTRGLLLEGEADVVDPPPAVAAKPTSSSRKMWVGAASGAVVTVTALVAAAGMLVAGVLSGVYAWRVYSTLAHGPDGRLVARDEHQARSDLEVERNRVVVGILVGTASGVVALLLLGIAGLGVAGAGGAVAWSALGS